MTKISKGYLVFALSFFIVSSIFFIVKPAEAAGKDWFVRPWGGSYGVADGTNYNTAWNGLDLVKWGTGGVVAGDTLWVCGEHGTSQPAGWWGYIGPHTQLIPTVSGTADQPINIRGDCSSFNSSYQNGTIYRTTYVLDHGWTSTGVNGVYKLLMSGSTISIYEDKQLLSRKPRPVVGSKPTNEELQAFQPGDWWKNNEDPAKYPDTAMWLYLKPKNGDSDPNKHSYAEVMEDAAIFINNQNYITVKNLNLFGGHVELDKSQHITLDGVNNSNSAYGIELHYNCSYFVSRNSTMDMVGDGIYFIISKYPDPTPVDPSFASNNTIIEYDTITNVTCDSVCWSGDQHAIGYQGGQNAIVRYNRIDNAATGPLFYGENPYGDMSAEVYGNYITNIYRQPVNDRDHPDPETVTVTALRMGGPP